MHYSLVCAFHAGSVVAGVVVTLVILVLVVVAGSVGLVVFLTYRRKAARLNGTAAINQNTSGFDNPISKSTRQECVVYVHLSGKEWTHLECTLVHSG